MNTEESRLISRAKEIGDVIAHTCEMAETFADIEEIRKLAAAYYKAKAFGRGELIDILAPELDKALSWKHGEHRDWRHLDEITEMGIQAYAFLTNYHER